ncbi:unnamed protein product [Chilo suppressalis]|uniref:5'-nucleotidase n=1 Tax=Chilo suppressalis TaxID=168631 RepID=A0ABN8B1X4_CHISP|nr:unnamed protein product [Chilo suppressalis]
MILNTLRIAAFLVVVALSSSSLVQSPTSKDTFELLILHNNDMHARFEQTSQLSGTCTTVDRDAGKCYGGFPRVAHVVKEARKAAASGEGPPVLYLNAGDTYTGTAWFTIYKWKIAAEFLNALQPDAVCLGNHEFDEGINGVVPFIRNLTSPILAANLILDAVPELANETNLHKSIILKIGDTRIGLIGYLTPETKFLAPKNKVEYEDEVTAIKREVEILKKQNINILIALGHSGFITDLKIAKEVDDIDLVIGGHSNTFLWNRNTTEEKPEFPQGMYPTIVTQPSGRKALVVQAYAYTKYMGYLNLIFDSTGEIVQYDGEPLLLEQSIPEDPEMLEKVNLYRKEIDEINNELVGESAVVLEGSCRLQECNLGNLITDSILDFTREFHPKYFDVNIAVIQGGRIRTSVDHPNKPIKVTRGDLVAVLPFSDMLTIITLNGTILKRAMEHSISTWRLIDSTGQFLQMSGMEVTYDLSQSPGSRLVDLKAVCSKCGDYTLKPVNDNNEYKMFMPSFLADGGDGYSIFENLPKDIISYNELECTINYMRKYGLVEPKVSGRITIINRDKINDIKANPLLNNCIRSTVSLALEIICVLISLNFL